MDGSIQVTTKGATAVTPGNWTVRPWNGELFCCTKIADPNEKPKKVAVIDIGSNTVKILISDVTKSQPVELASSKSHARLAETMHDHQNGGALSAAGICMLMDDGLPKFKNKILKHDPDTIVVVATEAMRRAYLKDPASVKQLCTRIATYLGIPAAAINIIPDKTECALAETATLSARPNMTGISIMGGGASLELTNLKCGKRVCDLEVLHIGSRTLSNALNPAEQVNRGLSSIPWLSRIETTSTAVQKTGFVNAESTLALLGGFFRVPGRVMGYWAGKTSLLEKLKPEGLVFANDEAFKSTLGAMKTTTRDTLYDQQLLDRFFPNEKVSDKKFKKWKDSKEHRHFQDTDDYHEIKSVLDRVSDFGVAHHVISAAINLIKPKEIIFLPQNLRDGVLAQFDLVSWKTAVSEKSDASSPSVQPRLFLAPVRGSQTAHAATHVALAH